MRRPALLGVFLIGLSIGLADSFRSIGLWALPSALVLFALGVFCLFVSAWRTKGTARGSSQGDDAAWGGGYLSGTSSKQSHAGHDGHGSHSSGHAGGDAGGDVGGGGGD
jgi:hypothetical protein